MTAKTINVSNAAELVAALKTATGGEKIELAAGSYGSLTVTQWQNNMHNLSNVTIESADPAHQAVFDTIKIGNQSNLTFNDIKVDVPFDGKTPLTGVAVSDSSHIAFTNSSVIGQLVTAAQQNLAADGGEGFIAGAGVGTGVCFRASSDVTFSHNEVAQFLTGTGFMDVTNMNVSYNNLHGMRNDVMDLAQIVNGNIQGNYFHDQLPVPDAEEHLHRDNIQLWSTNTTGPTVNLNIQDNIIVNTADTYRQSIWMRNDKAETVTDGSFEWKNITIQNNLIFGNHLHGTSGSYIDGLQIINNTYIASGDANSTNQPGIDVNHITNGVIANNVVTSQGIHVGDSSNVVTQNNYITQRTDASADNFVGKLFVDSMAGGNTNYTQGDLTAIAGSIIAQQHLGSNLTWSPSAMTAPSLYVKVDYGAGLDKQTITYDASTIFKTPVSLTGATIKLDFGDGTTSTSFDGTHTYAKPGIYSITGTITLPDGQTITGSEGVVVRDPRVLDIDFDKGLVDNSIVANTLTASGTTLVKTALGQSLHMDTAKSYVGLGRTFDTAGNDALTVSIAFKKDTASTSGTLFQQTSTGSISIDSSGKLVVQMMDGAGHNFTQKDSVSVNDTNWHMVTIAFDSAKGVANYYMDGQLVGTQTGFTAGQAIGNWEPTLGTPWGTSLLGDYDDVKYLSGTMTAAQVQAEWNALQAQLHPAASGDGSGTNAGTGADTSEATVQAQAVTSYMAAHADATVINGVPGHTTINTLVTNAIVHASADTTSIVSSSATGDDLVYGNDKGDFFWSKGGNDIFIGGAATIRSGARMSPSAAPATIT